MCFVNDVTKVTHYLPENSFEPNRLTPMHNTNLILDAYACKSIKDIFNIGETQFIVFLSKSLIIAETPIDSKVLNNKLTLLRYLQNHQEIKELSW